jgi:predicted lipoprotein with Yx(FWY)xxD motif
MNIPFNLVLLLIFIEIYFCKITSRLKIRSLSLSQLSQDTPAREPEPRVNATSSGNATGSIRDILPLFDTSRANLSSLSPLALKVRSSPLGEHLTDEIDIALYAFMGDAPNVSKCTGECVSKWIPFSAPANFSFIVVDRTNKINPALIGFIEREDGRRQVTYNKKPLYFYSKDKSPEDTLGQGLKDFGNSWYLISPEGEFITKTEEVPIISDRNATVGEAPRETPREPTEEPLNITSGNRTSETITPPVEIPRIIERNFTVTPPVVEAPMAPNEEHINITFVNITTTSVNLTTPEETPRITEINATISWVGEAPREAVEFPEVPVGRRQPRNRTTLNRTSVTMAPREDSDRSIDSDSDKNNVITISHTGHASMLILPDTYIIKITLTFKNTTLENIFLSLNSTLNDLNSTLSQYMDSQFDPSKVIIVDRSLKFKNGLFVHSLTFEGLSMSPEGISLCTSLLNKFNKKYKDVLTYDVSLGFSSDLVRESKLLLHSLALEDVLTNAQMLIDTYDKDLFDYRVSKVSVDSSDMVGFTPFFSPATMSYFPNLGDKRKNENVMSLRLTVEFKVWPNIEE